MSLGDHLPALRRLPSDELCRRLTATFLAKPTTQTRQLTEAIGRVLAERAVAS
jgi:molybdopterin biosynthesis enzyme